jgi:hypothetical protein
MLHCGLGIGFSRGATSAHSPNWRRAFEARALIDRGKVANELGGRGRATSLLAVTPEGRASAGAGPDVVRLSVGIEDVADIIAALDQALATV